MVCKNLCLRLQALKPRDGSGRYRNGQKRCQVCEIFINHDGLWCPCCGYRLRSKPRNKKYKENLKKPFTPKSAKIITPELERVSI